MNKRHKIRSREIKAIMNASKWGDVTYKGAKSVWKKGIRAFPVGLNSEWVLTDLSHLELSQKRMDELGWAVRHLIYKAEEKHMTLEIIYDRNVLAFKLYFRSNPAILRSHFGYYTTVTAMLIKRCISPIAIAGHIVYDMEYELSKLPVDTTAKIEIPTVSIPNDHRMLTPVEPILRNLIAKEMIQ